MEGGSLKGIPEGCKSKILSFTSPRDVCRSSLVSSNFRSAGESDIIWEKFLPSDYQDIISSSVSPSPVVFCSKKDLYFRLCDSPILIDGGNKSFALDKLSGKKCYMVGARELSIAFGDTQFSEVAELQRARWLEIRGKMETQMLSPRTTYAAYLVFKFLEGAYGFDSPPAEVSVRFVEGGEAENSARPVYLDPHDGSRVRFQLVQQRRGVYDRSIRHVLRRSPASVSRQQDGQFPRARGDGWMEIEMGEFINDSGEDGEVEMSLMEVVAEGEFASVATDVLTVVDFGKKLLCFHSFMYRFHLRPFAPF
ncbi:hypothetical protein HHK36_027036 [Tetracentron sinense]|uniref:F-box domain-containing protein n=1 Tax=Tetracentron sinense TaxID=13715 RepID=A0A834YHW0_TETSI|nr:hypothetical protein HHK36_027036 [Tetracentron sinense]